MASQNFPLAPKYYDQADQDTVRRLIERALSIPTLLGGSGHGSLAVKEGNVAFATGIDTIDFASADFIISHSPAGELNLSIEPALARLGTGQTWTALQSFGVFLGGTLQTAAQPNVTSVGVLTSLTMGGTLTIGANTLALATSTVTGAPTWSSNQAITLSTAAQPNVTSVGVLTSLTMGGTLTVGANTLALATSTVSGAPTWSSNQAITLSTAAQPNITSVGTLTALTVSGTATLNKLGVFGGAPSTSISAVVGSLASGLLLTGSTAQIGMTVGAFGDSTGTLVLTGLSTGIATQATGYTVATARALRIENGLLGAGSTITTLVGIDIASQTVGGTNFAIRTGTGQVSFGDALTVTSGGITVTGASTITGTLGGVTTLTATTLAGTLSTAAQPNITSLGTLTALTVSGTATLNKLGVFGGAPSTSISAVVGSLASGLLLTGSTAQIGLSVGAFGDSTGTLVLTGLSTGIATQATGYTVTTARALRVENGLLGAGSTITTLVGIDVANQTVGGTNFAIRTGTGQVQFGDALTVTSGGITVTGASTITGTLGGITTLTATTLAGTLSTAAQANVTSLGTLTSLRIAGGLGINTAPVTDTGVVISSALTGLTSLTGLAIAAVGDSGGTANLKGIQIGISTANAVFTITNVRGLHVLNVVKGNAGQTITTQVGVDIANMTSGATNYAIRTAGGTIRYVGAPAFAAGDKYLIIDANGDIHISALGPAS